MYDDINHAGYFFDVMKDAEDVGYLVAISTLDEGDFDESGYGLLPGHQYSVLALFTMTETDGTEHDMLLVRNPWKISYYEGEWDAYDSRWTDDLIA